MRINIELERFPWNAAFLDNVYNCGLNIVNAEDADVFVKATNMITEEDLVSEKKIIALERRDAGDILNRKLLHHPSIIRYVKQYKYTNFQLNNLPCLNGRLFTRFIAPEQTWGKIYPNINIDDYHKIFLGWNFLHLERMQQFISLNTRFDEEREIDVFFAGNLDYISEDRISGKIISEHRKNCVEVLKSINGLNVFAISGRKLSKKEYIEVLSNSKTVVSPWGWGEACYRDYESILAGCILIKPLTDFIDSSCGIFQQPLNVWSKPDFSDLELKIWNALKIFRESLEIRKSKRNLLITESLRIKTLVKSIFDF